MKELYLWILLVLSFESLTSSAQTQAEADSIKKYTNDFIKDKLSKDYELKVDTILVNTEDEVKGWAGFGEYNTGRCHGKSCQMPSVVIRYLATKLQNNELQNKIAFANGICPGIYRHEGVSHRGKLDYIYGSHHAGWSLYDYMQKLLSDELTARLSEGLDMREKILNKSLTKNMLKNITNNMPNSKRYNKDYFLWLTEHNIKSKISKEESDILLNGLIKWMLQPEGKDNYYETAAVNAGLYSGEDINISSNSNYPKRKIVNMDDFMNETFSHEQNFNGKIKKINVLKIASEETVQKFIKTIAFVLEKEKLIIEQGEERQKNGWSESIKKIKEKYKKTIKKDSHSKLRAYNYLNLTDNDK